ncbi:hypothetical protein PENANT_c001G08974 [Penicillium antarcticum]|uniref:Protection of telomeres protein 1 n=1 Tax=Penicillium antarcticum TaxID=416450 RepID=A0A1V6QNY1_9EURO|nr:uncharacterized protein N7508_010410 [Penicillium antarcticum]KAJ5295589.1 hypothetical protein N7508_010410 [Penicillium antarcticum]OQD90646.1 hypothetical protein PENANT_c001G08974 [Penicillium antarcticum]
MALGDLVSISTACTSRGTFSVLGVVVDTLPLFRTKGSSACVTFTIKDSEFDAPHWQGGLKVKYFNDDESHLPNVQVNDLVLLRSIRVSIYQNKPTGVVSQQESVSWIVFRPEPGPGSSLSTTTGPVPFEPSLWEKDQAQALLDLVTAEGHIVQPSISRSVPVSQKSSQVIQASTSNPKFGLPFSLIKDVKPGKFAQLLGQAIKLETHDSEKSLILMTDYTENPQLDDYKKPWEEDDEPGPDGDPFNYLTRRQKDWPGPFGQLTIRVTLWEPHATYAREHVKPGDIVLLTYVRIKENRGLEASVHEDRRFPEKIHIKVLNGGHDEREQALLKRRAEYWKIHGEPKADTKNAKKRNKKAQEQQKAAKKEAGQLILPAATGTKLNPNIKPNVYTASISSLEKILRAESHINHAPGGIVYQLPFQNVNYISELRVVDFFPPDLEDFAVQTQQAAESEDTETLTGWEWRFCLLVEGVNPQPFKQQPRERMKLFVSGHDGDCLLDMVATDLRRKSRRLNLMREKLFHLWGNLEERKQAIASGNSDPEPLSSLPFKCLIKEYGVPCTHEKDPNAMEVDGEDCSQPDCFGWERRFGIFGTTIHS